MDIVNLIISLVSGGVGGNLAGAALKDKSLGTLWNTIVGILGGGAGSKILAALGYGASTAAASGLDIGAILTEVGTSGVSGAAVLAIVSLIKNALNK